MVSRTPEPGADRALVEMLSFVLAELAFPALHWQIIAAAGSYGADAQTMARLHQLPTVTYPSLRHVAAAVAGATASSAQNT